jgi:opine dehydrogenase
MKRIRIGIAGAGSIAFATAALLHRRGHDVALWSPSGAGTASLASGEALLAEGAIEAVFTPRIAASAAELASNDALLIAVPGYAHRTVMDALAPHISDGQPVIISSHVSLGAIYLAEVLAARGIAAPITAWGTTAVTGRKSSPSAVRVNTIRDEVDLCTAPESAQPAQLALCTELFGAVFTPRAGLLAIALSNLNPQNHMAIALGNMSRMERGETWNQGQNVTPNIGRLMEQLDAERLAIAARLGLGVKTIFEHFHRSFHVPVDSIAAMNQAMFARGTGGTGPATADSRYVTEDVPYGLVPTAMLGELAGSPAPLHQAGVRIFSAMYGRDFAAENTLLAALDLKRRSLAELRAAAVTGRWPTPA